MFGPEELLVIGLICGGPLMGVALFVFIALRKRRQRLDTPMDRCKSCNGPLKEGAGQASILKLDAIAISWGRVDHRDWAWKNGPLCKACLESLQRNERPDWLREMDALFEQIESEEDSIESD